MHRRKDHSPYQVRPRFDGLADNRQRTHVICLKDRTIDWVLFDLEALDLCDFEEVEGRVERHVPSSVLHNLTRAMDLIATYASEYLGWVDRVVRQLFLINPRPHRVESGSYEDYLGMIHMSANADPLRVAELLVHEASHQYLNVLRKIEPVDDASDEAQYWSPPVHCHRPIAKLLTAFHAFGNVQYFYRL